MIDSTTNSRFSNKQLIVIYTIISLVSLLIVWELAARFTGASMFLPPASQVLAAFFRSFVEPIGKRTMLAHVGSVCTGWPLLFSLPRLQALPLV